MSAAALTGANSGGAPPTTQLPIGGTAATQAALTLVAVNPPVQTLPPASASTREQILSALDSIRPGAARADVLVKLGRPAFSIGSSDGPHYVERCRFRAGLENVASIEFRDGVVAAVDRIVP